VSSPSPPSIVWAPSVESAVIVSLPMPPTARWCRAARPGIVAVAAVEMSSPSPPSRLSLPSRPTAGHRRYRRRGCRCRPGRTAVIAVAAEQEVVVIAAVDDVVAGIAEQVVEAGAARQLVGAVPTEGAVAARLAEQLIVALAARQQVVAIAAFDDVIVFLAVQAVIALATMDDVVAGQSEDIVVAAERIERVVAGRAGQRFAIVGARELASRFAALDGNGGGRRRGHAILVLDGVVDDDDGAFAGGEIVEIAARIEADLVFHDRDTALPGRARGRGDGEDGVVVDVDVIAEDVDHDGRALARRPRVRIGDRAVIGAGDGDGDRRGSGRTMLVLDGVADHDDFDLAFGQGVAWIELNLVADHRGGAVAGRRRGGGHGEDGAVVDVGVVGERVDQDRRILAGGGRVGIGDRAVIGAGDGQSDRRARRGAESALATGPSLVPVTVIVTVEEDVAPCSS
jgi:hypothetical protein